MLHRRNGGWFKFSWVEQFILCKLGVDKSWNSQRRLMASSMLNFACFLLSCFIRHRRTSDGMVLLGMEVLMW